MMTDWKQLERHPLSAEYEDITGTAWMRFCASFKRLGFLPDRPIILHQRKVLDGWQRLRACIETNTEPVFATFPEDADPESFVEAMNDDRRKEETGEVVARRMEARRQRVAERRKAGDSTRKIAEAEGISQSTVQRDIAEASTESGDSVEPPDGKVNSKDGKKRPAKKPIPRCDRCTRLFADPKKSRPGCVGCYEARKAAKKPDEADEPFVQETNELPPEVVDDAGKAVPENLLGVFRAVALFNKLEKQLAHARQTAKEIENLKPLKAKKPINGQKHYGELWGPLRNSRSRVIAMRPALVCECGGKGCEACRNDGYLTQEEVDAKGKEPVPA